LARGVRNITFGDFSRRSEKWSPRQGTDGLTPTARRDFCNVWVDAAGDRVSSRFLQFPEHLDGRKGVLDAADVFDKSLECRRLLRTQLASVFC